MEDAKRRVLIRVIGAPVLVISFAFIIWADYKYESLLGTSSLVFLISIFSLNEFYTLCILKGYKPARIAGIILLALGQAVVAYAFELLKIKVPYYILFSFTFSLVMIYVVSKLVVKYGEFSIIDAGLTVFGYLYVWQLGSLINTIPLQFSETGMYLILYIVIVVKSSDIFAYCVGKMMGERKLAPSISPNKTWEGAIGGLVAGILAGTIFLHNTGIYKVVNSTLPLIIMTTLVTIASQMGDLVESALKRWAGVKDSGKFFPEFGGFLDMVDGFLLAIPVYHICERIIGIYISR